MFVATQKPTPPWKDVSCLRNTQKRHLYCEVWLTIFLYFETETRVEIHPPFRNCLQIELLFSVNFKGEVTLSTGLLWIRQVLNQSTPNPPNPRRPHWACGPQTRFPWLAETPSFPAPTPGLDSRMDSVGKTVWQKRALISHGHIQHTELWCSQTKNLDLAKEWSRSFFWSSNWHEKLWQAYGRFVHCVRRGSRHISRVTSSCLWLPNWTAHLISAMAQNCHFYTADWDHVLCIFFVSSGHRLSTNLWLSNWQESPLKIK